VVGGVLGLGVFFFFFFFFFGGGVVVWCCIWFGGGVVWFFFFFFFFWGFGVIQVLIVAALHRQNFCRLSSSTRRSPIASIRLGRGVQKRAHKSSSELSKATPIFLLVAIYTSPRPGTLRRLIRLPLLPAHRSSLTPFKSH